MQSDAEFLRRARQSYRSSFGSVRVDVAALTRRDLRSRHVLWLHGWAMGLLTLGVMWLTTALLRWAGVDTLALRYALTLGLGYLCYLALVRVWGADRGAYLAEQFILPALHRLERLPGGIHG